MKTREFLSNLLLVSLSVLSCLVLFELALRAIYPKPSGDYVTSLEYRHRWAFNSDGFREDEFGGKLGKNKENIMLLGDSFTAGLGVERQDSFASLLSDKLKERYEVFNLGKPATGTLDQKKILQQWVGRIHPRQVVLFFFWNDVADNFITPKDSPYQRLQTAELSKERPFFTFLKPVKPWLRKTMLYEFISQRYRILLTKVGISKLDYGMEFDLFERDTRSLAVKIAWENTRASLLEIKALCDARSADLYVVYLPKREQINHWENVIQFYKADPGRYDRFQVNRTLGAFCASRNIHFIDPSFELDKRPDKEAYYYQFDSHLTRAGNRAFFDVFYRSLADYLR